MRILITGATGCVGSYLLRGLLQKTGHEVVALIRHPSRLAKDLYGHPRLQILQADLCNIDRIGPFMTGIDTAFLVATSWGGPDSMTVTCDANLALTDLLAKAGCARVFYFATASVLGRDGALLDAARDHGTEYIRAKHALTLGMEARASSLRVTGLFPTLVLGGDPAGRTAPLSHLGRLLPQVLRRIGLVRFIDAEARFHLIHAADIASVCLHLLDHPELYATTEASAERLVLGNPATDFDTLIRQACRHLGRKRRRIVTLRPRNAAPVIWAFRIRLSPWDAYCLHHPDQSYDAAINPASLGLPVDMPDLAAGLKLIGIAAKG